MSLLNDKRNIFDTISSIKSMEYSKSPKSNSLYSTNNKKEPLLFLIDLLSVLVGVNGLINFSSKLIMSIYNDVDKTTRDNLLNKSINYYSDRTINETNLKNGFTVNVEEIDLFGKLKINPNSLEGEKIYDINSGNDYYFDYSLYNIINGIGGNSIGNTEFAYNSNNDTIFIKPLNINQNVHEYIEEFLGSNNGTKNTFVNSVLAKMFGVGGGYKNKTTNQIIEELSIEIKLNNYVNEGTTNLSSTNNNDIEHLSESLNKGVRKVNWGCGYFESNIELEDLDELSNIINNGNETEVTNSLLNLFDKSTNNNENRKQTSKNDFGRSMIINMNNELLKQYVLSPKYMVYKKIIQVLNDVDDDNIDNLIKDDSVLCVSNTVNNKINEELFKLVKKELTLLIKPFAKTIMKEKSNQLLGILKSLISII